MYRFQCTSTTTVCPFGGLYIQVQLYINYSNYRCPFGGRYTGSTACTSTTTVCPLGGLYIQVPLYINYYSVSLLGPVQESLHGVRYPISLPKGLILL